MRSAVDAMIQVDSRGQNCILIFHGSNYNIDEAYVDSVLDQFESGDMVVLPGCDQYYPLYY